MRNDVVEPGVAGQGVGVVGPLDVLDLRDRVDAGAAGVLGPGTTQIDGHAHWDPEVGEVVFTRTAVDHVVTRFLFDEIAAAVAPDPVVTGSPVELVVTRATRERVVAIVAGDVQRSRELGTCPRAALGADQIVAGPGREHPPVELREGDQVRVRGRVEHAGVPVDAGRADHPVVCRRGAVPNYLHPIRGARPEVDGELDLAEAASLVVQRRTRDERGGRDDLNLGRAVGRRGRRRRIGAVDDRRGLGVVHGRWAVGAADDRAARAVDEDDAATAGLEVGEVAVGAHLDEEQVAVEGAGGCGLRSRGGNQGDRDTKGGGGRPLHHNSHELIHPLHARFCRHGPPDVSQASRGPTPPAIVETPYSRVRRGWLSPRRSRARVRPLRRGRCGARRRACGKRA